MEQSMIRKGRGPRAVNSNHSEVLPIIPCDGCGYVTKRWSNLARHKRSMHERHIQDFTCCGSRYRNKAEYKVHRLAAHSNGYECPDCSKVFSRRALLHRHSSIHTGLREFRCHLCNYESSHKSNLQRHINARHEIRKYIKPDSTGSSYCNFCPCPVSKCQPPPVISHSIASILNLRENKHKNLAMGAAAAATWGDNEVSSTTTAIFSGYHGKSPTPSPNASYMYYPTIVPAVMGMEPQPQYCCGFGFGEPIMTMTQPQNVFPSTGYDLNNNSEWNYKMEVHEENSGIPNTIAAAAIQSNPDETDTFSNYVPKKWRVVKGRVA